MHESVRRRYLAARGHNVAKASQALRKTLQWRKEFRPDAIMFEDVAACATGGRVELLQNLDKQQRPVLMYRLRWGPDPAAPGSAAVLADTNAAFEYPRERHRSLTVV